MSSMHSDEEGGGPKTIDQAIKECEHFIRRHRRYSIAVLALMLICTTAFYFAFKSQQITLDIATQMFNSGAAGPNAKTTDASEWTARRVQLYFAFIGLFLVIFGVLVALYRHHLREITRNEQMKLGFWRIRIAARNTESGFQSEVRRALTKDAFSFEGASKEGKSKNLESPIPGHPGSDLATAFLNKILENFEFDVKKKS